MSIVQYIVYFNQNVNNQALWGGKNKQTNKKHVFLAEKDDYFEWFPPPTTIVFNKLTKHMQRANRLRHGFFGIIVAKHLF